MKFCTKCGAKVDDLSLTCPNCGSALNSSADPFDDRPVNSTSSKYNTLCILGFVFSFLFALVGLILSIVGLKKAKSTGEQGAGLAIAGIVISIVNWVTMFLIEILFMQEFLAQLGLAALL